MIKIIFRFALAFTLTLFAVSSHLAVGVSAQAQMSNYCLTPETYCKAQAGAIKTSCVNACTQPKGSAAYNQCVQNCTNTYATSVNNCTAQFNTCIQNQTQACKGSYCPSIGACASPNSLKSATYSDPTGDCVCNCECSGSPPQCSGVTCSGNGSWACDSPILIDYKGEGFHLTNVQDGVWFDFQGNGNPEHIAWTDPAYSNGWLVLDRNGNGAVDNASELFGNVTEQPSSPDANGYLALAVFDQVDNGGNDDGFISSDDAVFSKLRVWIDANHDGISQQSELHNLVDLGISRLDLAYKEEKKTDEYGNLFRYRARVWDHRGQHGNRFTYDVFLQ